MNRGSSFAKSSEEDTQKPEKKSLAFKDISKYFSKEEWAELGYSEKVTYVYMKRSYDTMTNLGLRATLPPFMHPNRWATKSQLDDSDEDQNPGTQDEPPQMASSVQQSEHPKMKPKKPTKEENDSKVVPGTADLMRTSGSEEAEKQPCLPEKSNTSGQQSKQTPDPTTIYQLFSTTVPGKEETKVWACRLRKRNNLVAYEEISDPEAKN
ncbi:protein SSX7-like [Trichechus inunguis]